MEADAPVSHQLIELTRAVAEMVEAERLSEKNAFGAAAPGHVVELAQRRAEGAAARVPNLIGSLQEAVYKLAMGALAKEGIEPGAASQRQDVHVRWLMSSNQAGRAHPFVAEVCIRDAAEVEGGLSRQWLIQRLARGETEHDVEKSDDPPQPSSGAVTQAPFNWYHSETLRNEDELVADVSSTTHSTHRDQGLPNPPRGGPLHGLGFLEGILTSTAAGQVNTIPQPAPGTLFAHPSLRPKVKALYGALQRAVIEAPLPEPATSAGSFNAALCQYALGLYQDANSSDGTPNVLISSSMEAATAAAVNKSEVGNRAAGHKRPREELAPFRVSRLGLQAVYYVVELSASSMPEGRGLDADVKCGSACYCLVQGYHSGATAASLLEEAPSTTDDGSQATNKHPPSLQPITAASALPTAFVMPTRELDFVARLVRYEPRL